MAVAINQVANASLAGEPRLIKPSGKTVPSLNCEVVISIHTKCPAKWAMVDMETGDMWRHDGSTFFRLTSEQAGDVAALAHQVSLQS